MEVRLKVRQYRLMRGMEQEELAAMIDVQQPYISKIENGRTLPNIKTLCYLARALHCGPGDLIDCRD